MSDRAFDPKLFEKMLAPFIVWSWQHKMGKIGFPQKPEMIDLFKRATLDPMADMSDLKKAFYRKSLADAGAATTGHLQPPDPRDLLLACLGFIPALSARGLFDNNLLASFCTAEITEMEISGLWAVNQDWVAEATTGMFRSTRAMGYYRLPSL